MDVRPASTTSALKIVLSLPSPYHENELEAARGSAIVTPRPK
jgi:hypothetical protein